MERRDKDSEILNLPAMTAAERREAVEVEAVLHSYYEQADALSDAGSRASFASVHQRLMTEIEADVSAVSIDAEPFEAPVMLLPTSPSNGYVESGKRKGKTSLVWPSSLLRRFLPAQSGWYMGMVVGVALLAASAGHHIGRTNAMSQAVSSAAAFPVAALPVQSLEDDYDATLHAPAPIEFVSDNGEQTSSWLSQQTGHPVRLPRLQMVSESKLRLLGASRHALGGLQGRAVAQAHYLLAGGARVTLYQLRAPHLGLVGLREEAVNGRTFFIKREGRYHTVVWRSGDDLLAIVSPLSSYRALALAAALRASQPADVI